MNNNERWRTEDVLTPDEIIKITKASQMTDEEFEAILEEVEDDNPYAKELIRKSRSNRNE